MVFAHTVSFYQLNGGKRFYLKIKYCSEIVKTRNKCGRIFLFNKSDSGSICVLFSFAV